MLRSALALSALLLSTGFAGAATGVGATKAEQPDADVPAYTLSLSPDGHALQLSGGVRFGLARDLRTMLDATPGIKTVILTSPGGRLAEAETVAHLIKARGLDTYVPRYCYSACTRIFVAGKARMLGLGGKLGFHGAALTAQLPTLPARVVLWGVNQTEIANYVADGIDSQFMQRAIAVKPPGIWQPTAKELLAAHVITAQPGNQPSGALGLPAPVPPPPPPPVPPI
jgi:hypothetical protein